MEDEEIQQAEEELERLSEEGAECARTGEIEFSRSDGDGDGVFNMTLATNGEASDGHILNVMGAESPESGRVPLLLGHQSTVEIPSLGSVTDFRKSRGTPQRLRAKGRFNLTGDETDGLLPARRGVWNLVEAGDLPAVSVRWRGLKSTPRINLPKSHPAFVDAEKADYPQRYGVFFEKWRVLEGSVVAIGADPQALIGRAAAIGPELERLFRRLDLPGRSKPDLIESELRAAFDVCRNAGLEGDELAALVARVLGAETAQADLIRYTYLDGDTVREHWLPRGAHDALVGHSPKMLSDVLAAIDGLRERMTQQSPPRRSAPSQAPTARPASKPTPATPKQRQRTVADLPARELAQLIGSAVSEAVKPAIDGLTVGRVRR